VASRTASSSLIPRRYAKRRAEVQKAPAARVLRSLDAIHLAAALMVAAQLEAVVTYDARMAAAARLLGLRVAAPA